MCNWQDIVRPYGKGRINLSAQVVRDSCNIIWQRAQKKQRVAYSELMNILKQKGHRKINRATIGHIVGEVSTQVSQVTNPSIYPSAIVVRKGTDQPGKGFWGLDDGSSPPSAVPQNHQRQKMQQYQDDVFNKSWNCSC